jgi:hypothetical protein
LLVDSREAGRHLLAVHLLCLVVPLQNKTREREPQILVEMGVREDEVRKATWERRKGSVRAVALFLVVDHLGQVLMSSSLCYSQPPPPSHLKKYVMTSATETQMEMTRRGKHEERADWGMRREARIGRTGERREQAWIGDEGEAADWGVVGIFSDPGFHRCLDTDTKRKRPKQAALLPPFAGPTQIWSQMSWTIQENNK